MRNHYNARNTLRLGTRHKVMRNALQRRHPDNTRVDYVPTLSDIESAILRLNRLQSEYNRYYARESIFSDCKRHVTGEKYRKHLRYIHKLIALYEKLNHVTLDKRELRL